MPTKQAIKKSAQQISKVAALPTVEQEEENLEESPLPPIPKEREAHQSAITVFFMKTPEKLKGKAEIQVEAAKRKSSEKSNVGKRRKKLSKRAR